MRNLDLLFIALLVLACGLFGCGGGHFTGSLIIGTAANATSATGPFIYEASCAGTPTGVPTAFAGRVPTVIDTTAGKLWAYYGAAWHYTTFT